MDAVNEVCKDITKETNDMDKNKDSQILVDKDIEEISDNRVVNDIIPEETTLREESKEEKKSQTINCDDSQQQCLIDTDKQKAIETNQAISSSIVDNKDVNDIVPETANHVYTNHLKEEEIDLKNSFVQNNDLLQVVDSYDQAEIKDVGNNQESQDFITKHSAINPNEDKNENNSQNDLEITSETIVTQGIVDDACPEKTTKLKDINDASSPDDLTVGFSQESNKDFSNENSCQSEVNHNINDLVPQDHETNQASNAVGEKQSSHDPKVFVVQKVIEDPCDEKSAVSLDVESGINFTEKVKDDDPSGISINSQTDNLSESSYIDTIGPLENEVFLRKLDISRKDSQVNKEITEEEQFDEAGRSRSHSDDLSQAGYIDTIGPLENEAFLKRLYPSIR